MISLITTAFSIFQNNIYKKYIGEKASKKPRQITFKSPVAYLLLYYMKPYKFLLVLVENNSPSKRQIGPQFQMNLVLKTTQK